MLIGWHKTCKCKTEFTHKGGNGRPRACVELDHYARRCPNPPFPRVLAELLYMDTQEKRYGRDEWVPSASQISADPIEKALMINNDYVDDPLANRFMLRGTFAHESLERRLANVPDYENEIELEWKVNDNLTIFGTADALYKPEMKLIDFKTQAEYALTKKGKQTDKEIFNDPQVGNWVRANANQINAYAVLMKEAKGIEVKSLELLYMDGRLRTRPLAVPMIEHEKMKRILVERLSELQKAVKGERPLESYEPQYNVNQFPLTKSPIRYLYKRVVARREAEAVS